MASNLLAKPGSAPTRSTPIEDYPRAQVSPATSTLAGNELRAATVEGGAETSHLGAKAPGGIKAATVGTTVYLLPSQHKRVKRLALDLDVASVHELLLLGLDRLLKEKGEPPILRYSQPRSTKS